jgi:hypothetical protein
MIALVDQRLVIELSKAVQDRLETEATSRVQSGRPPLHREAQEALADDVLRTQLNWIDAERIGKGESRLDEQAERALVERVMALCVGLGPAEVLLADPSVEEVVGTRFDLLFTYHSNGDLREVDERMWRSDAELDGWIAPGPHGRAHGAPVQ